MDQREIAAYFSGTLGWHELTPTAQHFLTVLLGRSESDATSDGRVLQTRRHLDRLGPLARVTIALDTCSGMRGGWVSTPELTAEVMRDEFFVAWVTGLVDLGDRPVESIIAAVIETWTSLELAGELQTELEIETTIGPHGVLWRTLRRPITDPDGTAGAIVEFLRHRHDGISRGEVQGRTHLSLPRLEVFVGVDLAHAAERGRGHEAPLVLSAITGMDLPDSLHLDELLDEYVNHVDTPTDLTFEIVRGVGLQVWMDRVIDGTSIGCSGLDRLVEDFIVEAHRLQESLEPYDRDPPGDR